MNRFIRKGLTIKLLVMLASAIVRSFEIFGAKGTPSMRTENIRIVNIVHRNRDAEHGC